jgi:quinol monooxygenase YgiN
MQAVETYAKYRIAAGQFPRFTQLVDAIDQTLASRRSSVPRADWFAGEAKGEAIAITVYRDETAYREVAGLLANLLAELNRICTTTIEILGGLAAECRNDTTARTHRFAYGINARPTPLATAPASDRIEIFTQFNIKPGRLAQFEALGAEMTRIVRERDPGTIRYDWYYDDASRHCFALDTYADPPSMFAHMKNCHAIHERMIAEATMVTEFLGELPEAAQNAVARYDPYILPLHRRLH